MENKFEKVFFHIDLDAFFASVEQREHPEYKGKPVIVGGIPGDRRAVVSTASYEARKYGVHSAMPLTKAVQLCPEGIYVRGNYSLYSTVSNQIMNIFKRYSPYVTQISIDEAFLDMTGTEKLFGKKEDVARQIKQEIFNETRLTVSIGISSSMYVSKIASGLNKPDGLTIVNNGDEEKFMLSLPLNKVWGIGDKTLAHIKSCGFYSTKDIYEKSESFLTTLFGNNTGSYLYNAVRGNKNMTFNTPAKNPSLGIEKTFEYDLQEKYSIEGALFELAQNLMWRLLNQKVRAQTLTVKIRYEDFETVTIQETFENAFTTSDELYETAKKLFYKKYKQNQGIRLLGLSCSSLISSDDYFQTDLFDFNRSKKAKLEKTIFEMESKNPSLKVVKARLYENHKTQK